jgi:DMSO reductase anchor subunit
MPTIFRYLLVVICLVVIVAIAPQYQSVSTTDRETSRSSYLVREVFGPNDTVTVRIYDFSDQHDPQLMTLVMRIYLCLILGITVIGATCSYIYHHNDAS